MAKCSRTCQTLFVLLFLNFSIYLGLGESDEIHIILKRDTINTSVNTNATSVQYSTEKPPVESSLPPKKITAVPLEHSVSNVSLPSLQNVHKNLGVNGTGIRKDYNTTHPPPLVHDIEPPQQNSSTNTNQTHTHLNTLKPANETDDHHQNGDDISIGTSLPSDFDTEEGEKKFNETLSEHNVTSTKTDPNLFYNTTIFSDRNIGLFYWVNMTNRSDVKVNDLLSQSHRRAATVKLSFDFPFYGHLIKNVTIATGGFLYTGEYVHSWLAATQYIAPLMANFDTSLSNESFIKYVDNGTAFTVEWEKVTLQDKPQDGEFTFQVTLFKNGDIVFVYENVPLLVDEIQELHHPVKVGLSDAYIMDQFVFLVRRKTIYEYDRVNFNKTHIKSWTTIVLKAFPTCLDAHDCETCLTRNLNFKCFWCPSMGKCSQGFDRHRQNWLAHHCDKTSFENVSTCASFADHPIVEEVSEYSSNIIDHNEKPKALSGKIMHTSSVKEDGGFSGILAILFLVGMISGLSLWVFYAYRNPHTTSGQILIRYRPSQWRWRRGEARYTAATIHM